MNNFRSFLNVTVGFALALSAVACGTASTQTGNLSRPYYINDANGQHTVFNGETTFVGDGDITPVNPKFEAMLAQVEAEENGQPVQDGDSHFVAGERPKAPQKATTRSLRIEDRNTSCQYAINGYPQLGDFATPEQADAAFQTYIANQPCTGKECDIVVKANVVMACSEEDRLAKVSSK